ncbi:nucleoside-diphosphate kinase [Mesorhizobium sp. SP-1A]|uniref:nucleoside-diphosphate kinase n=1 Tax=Mesorhizobium sp. SP-1A TaxID=3077840 RepID=UPI0028F7143C|nr:nucleoside-diphosphate kinase [Mesorhizobium sp. SP-1A]
MSATETFHLTTKDYTILEVMQERAIGRDETLAQIVRRKISNAVVMFREDIAPTVATLSSRVVYRIDDGPAETRIIAHDTMRGLVGTILPITNPRGLALLGLSEGQSMEIAKAGGGFETVTLQTVAYQPEAAQRELDKTGQTRPQPTRQRGPILRVVHRSDDLPPRPAQKHAASGPDDGFDDPGPSAA